MDSQVVKDRVLAGAVSEWMKSLLDSHSSEVQDIESLEVAYDCLLTAFGIGSTEGSFPLKEVVSAGFNAHHETSSKRTTYDDPKTEADYQKFISALKEKGYFNGVTEGSAEYAQRIEKVKAKFDERLSHVSSSAMPSGETTSQAKLVITEEMVVQGEEFKKQGNAALQSGQFEEAVSFYTKAIGCNPQNAVFFCNRAAAHSHLEQYDEAIRDCECAVEIDPNYAKAYSRLGFAKMEQKDYEGSLTAYRKSLALDPSNTAVQQSIDSVSELLKQSQPAATEPSQPTSAPNSGGGGMDFASMMSNMMSNPQIMQMAGQMAGQMGGGGFDMSSLLNNPMMANLGQMFGASPSQPQGGDATVTDADAADGTSDVEVEVAGPSAPVVEEIDDDNDESIHTEPRPENTAAPNFPDLSGLLNNPNLMNMASQMMQNPAFQSIAESMMGSMGQPPESSEHPEDE